MVCAAASCALQETASVATDVLSITPQDSVCNTATVFGGPAETSVAFISTTTARDVVRVSVDATNDLTPSPTVPTGM